MSELDARVAIALLFIIAMMIADHTGRLILALLFAVGGVFAGLNLGAALLRTWSVI